MLSKASAAAAIGMISCLQPMLFTKSNASCTEWSDEYLEGINTAITFSAPKALHANAQTTAESTPPDKPKTAFLKPDLEKQSLMPKIKAS
ncbi:hypothetical protein D3C85_1502190 [compost metagenome]